MALKLVKRQGSDVWYIHGSVRGERIRESTGTTDRALAEEKMAQRAHQTYQQKYLGHMAPVAFVDAVAAYLQFTPRKKGEIERYQRLVAHFGSTSLMEIDQAAADLACVKIHKTAATAPTRVRNVYTPLGALIKFGARRNWCSVIKFETPRVGKSRTHWITPKDAAALIAAAQPHLKPLLIFCFCTGARLSEALDLVWDDVDLKAARVIFRDVKNGRSGGNQSGLDRIARLPPAAVMALANLEPTDADTGRRSGSVFLTEKKVPYVDRGRNAGGQIRSAWRTACARVPGLATPKLDDKRRPVKDARGRVVMTPLITPHDMRHSWATWFYAVTKDLLLLQNEGGWQTITMVQRYAHLMDEDLIGDIPLVWGPSHPRIAGVLRDNRASEHSDVDRIQSRKGG